METNFIPLGDARLRRVLDGLMAEGDGAEAHYLEVKSDIDLTTSLGLAKVAKFILGAANRMPAQAEKHFRGHAVMALGVGKGVTPGIPAGTESHELHDKLSKYLSPDGPGFDLGRLPVSDEREVLFVVVDPPSEGQPPYPCHKDFQPGDRNQAKHSLQNGALYVRPNSATRVAKAPEVLALHARGHANLPDPVDLQIEVIGQPARLCDEETLLKRWIIHEGDDYREMHAKAREKPVERDAISLSLLMNAGPPVHLSPSEVEKRVQTWKSGVEERWPEHMRYLAGAALDGIGFRVTNLAASYLSKPRIDVTFHGCIGVEWCDPQNADLDEVLSPVVPKQNQPWGIPPIGRLAHRDYPVGWSNKGQDLIVTLTPDALRPKTPWASDLDDIVVLARDAGAEGVEVSWVATSEGRGETFSGQFPLPTQPPTSVLGLLGPLFAQTN